MKFIFLKKQYENEIKIQLESQHCKEVKERNKFNENIQDLYTENYKTLPSEIKENKLNGEIFYISQLEDSILLLYQLYPN